jgi:hypothetical protein
MFWAVAPCKMFSTMKIIHLTKPFGGPFCVFIYWTQLGSLFYGGYIRSYTGKVNHLWMLFTFGKPRRIKEYYGKQIR